MNSNASRLLATTARSFNLASASTTKPPRRPSGSVAPSSAPSGSTTGFRSERRYWTEPELAILRQHYPHQRTADLCALLPGRNEHSIYNKALELGLKKTPEHLASAAAGRIQRGQQHPGMVATQFKPGLVPHNKGKPFETARTNPAVREHQFKPGARPHTWLPVGSYRLNKDGHLQRKIADVPGNANLRWRNVAELVWIEVHGPLPKGHLVVFRPGQHTNKLEQITLDRLECISRRENMRRNSVWTRMNPEIARLTQLKGAITRQVNRITREHQEKETTP